jgi:hypothetical protein
LDHGDLYQLTQTDNSPHLGYNHKVKTLFLFVDIVEQPGVDLQMTIVLLESLVPLHIILLLFVEFWKVEGVVVNPMRNQVSLPLMPFLLRETLWWIDHHIEYFDIQQAFTFIL